MVRGSGPEGSPRVGRSPRSRQGHSVTTLKPAESAKDRHRRLRRVEPSSLRRLRSHWRSHRPRARQSAVGSQESCVGLTNRGVRTPRANATRSQHRRECRSGPGRDRCGPALRAIFRHVRPAAQASTSSSVGLALAVLGCRTCDRSGAHDQRDRSFGTVHEQLHRQLGAGRTPSLCVRAQSRNATITSEGTAIVSPVARSNPERMATTRPERSRTGPPE